MSDRANARRYTGAPDISFPTTPQGGGTGLLSLLTGNDPKSLLKLSQGFSSQENEKGRQHEDEVNKMLNDYQQQIMKLEAELKDKLANSEYIRTQATKSGAGSVEDYVSQVAPIATQRAVADMHNQANSMNSDAVKNATTTGLAADKLQSTVPLTMASKLQSPMGGIATGTDYASGRTSPDVAKGSLQEQETSLAPTMVDPNTGKPISFAPVTRMQNKPASFTPGGGIPGNSGIPMMDPSIRASILNNNSQSGMTPPDDYRPTIPGAFPPNAMFDNAPRTNAQPTIPIPANAQTNNGAPKNPYAAYGGYGINPQGQNAELLKQQQQELLKQQLQELINKLRPTIPSNVNPLQQNPWGQLQMP